MVVAALVGFVAALAGVAAMVLVAGLRDLALVSALFVLFGGAVLWLKWTRHSQVSDLPLFIEGATGSRCYVVHRASDGQAGLYVPGRGLEPFHPSVAEGVDDDFEGSQELEAHIRVMSKVFPPWHRIAIPFTGIFGLFFGMSLSMGRELLWSGNIIMVAVWLASMAPLVRLRSLMRDQPTVGTDGMVLRWLPIGIR